MSRATFPKSVKRSMFGPNLMALVVLLTGAYRMSKRSVASLLSSAFGISVAVGTISNIEHRVTRALRVPVEILKAMVQMARVVYADETTWKERAHRVYIWAAVTNFGAVYLVRASRAALIAVELLGTEAKVVVTDRYKGYLWIPLRWRQICWAHLKRDFEWIAGFAGEPRRIGRELLACEKELFTRWHRVRDGTLKRSSFRTLVSSIRKRIRSLLEEGEALDLDGVSGMCTEMLKVHVAFYTFVRVEGVEPTNNTVEARQRHPAIWRRVSFGTWSRRGSEYVGHILSVVTTLKIQGRQVLPYLRDACQAALEGRNAPLLVSLDAEETCRDAA
jgi:transposase